MKIAVNTRLLRKNRMDGIGWFTYNTLKKITNDHPEIEFHFFFDSGIDKSFLFSDNIIAHNLFPPAKHALLNILWFEWSVKRKLEAINPDLFLSPDGILCLGWSGKQYGVIHDINFVHMPQVLKYSNRKYYNHFFPKYANKASRIGTVSQYSKNDIVNTFKINEQKVDVLYNGINSFYHPISERDAINIKLQFTEGHDYFVFIGTLSPRKNMDRLMKAYNLYRKANGNSKKLIIAGGNMYKANELFALQNQLDYGKDIIFTGRLTDNMLNQVLGAASAMVFVPLFEGFGIPIIEAMQCNVPVIASNVSSVPEVAGDAALFVDPFNIEEIAEAMHKISGDILLRNDLIAKGHIRKQKFSWDKTGTLLWESIKKII